MSRYYLLNPVRMGDASLLWPGTLIDDRAHDVAKLQSAGAVLIADSVPQVAAAAAIAAGIKARTGDLGEATVVMALAYTASAQSGLSDLTSVVASQAPAVAIQTRAGVYASTVAGKYVIQGSNVPLSAARPYDYGADLLCWLYEGDLAETAGDTALWPAHLPGGVTGDQATTANQPTIELASQTNTKRARFTKADGNYMTLTGLAAKLSSGGNCISHTVIARFRPLSVLDSNIFARTSSAGAVQYYLTNNPGLRMLEADGAVAHDTWQTHSQCTQIAAWVFDRENGRMSIYGNGGSDSAPFTPTVGDAPTACYLGGYGAANNFDGWIHELIVLRGARSYAEFLALQKWFNRDYVQGRIAGVGNSFMAGTTLLGSIESVLPPAYGVFCAAAAGALTTEQLYTYRDTVIAPQLVAGDKILLIEDGNSILFGDTIAQLRTAAANWLAWANNLGFDLIRPTVTPRTAFTAPQEALRVAWNPELKNYTTRGMCPDYAALPHAADPSNTTYYSDGTHPTPLLAGEMGVAMRAMLIDAAY